MKEVIRNGEYYYQMRETLVSKNSHATIEHLIGPEEWRKAKANTLKTLSEIGPEYEPMGHRMFDLHNKGIVDDTTIINFVRNFTNLT